MSDLKLLKEINARKTLLEEFRNTGILNREASIKTINSFNSFALSKYICLNNLDISSLSTSPEIVLITLLKIQIELYKAEMVDAI